MSAAIYTCPVRGLTALEVRVLNEKGQTLEDVAVTVKNGEGKVLHDKTSKEGIARFVGLGKKPHEATLSAMHETYWKPGESRALPEGRARADSPASWVSPEDESAVQTHEVDWGECLYSISHQYGLPPEAIWSLPLNDGLTKKPNEDARDEPVLKPTDKLEVPTRKIRWTPVDPGNQYDFILSDRDYVFRVDLFDDDDERTSLECLVEVEGEVITVATDDKGVLEVPVLPTTEVVKVTISELEEFEATLGSLLPVSTVGGVERRLLNMGYLVYPLSDYDESEAVIVLSAAIRWFQSDYGVEETGRLDEEGRELLLDAHGS
jgi:hypothetical protein